MSSLYCVYDDYCQHDCELTGKLTKRHGYLLVVSFLCTHTRAKMSTATLATQDHRPHHVFEWFVLPFRAIRAEQPQYQYCTYAFIRVGS